MKISIIIPSYNAGEFIGTTLLSIRKQRYDDFEVIIADGGSSDDTGAVVGRFADLPIRFVSRPDKGQLDALQSGIAMASGEVLHWLNADDVMMPDALRTVAAAFGDRTVDLVFSDDFAFDQTRRRLFAGATIRGLSYLDHALFYRQMYSECIYWRTRVTRLLPPDMYDLRVRTDYAFFINLRRGVRERWLPRRLGAFRIRAGQISQEQIGRKAEELRRIRAAIAASNGWTSLDVALRRLCHAPGFALRQGLVPAAERGVRRAYRLLSGDTRRAAMAAAFFDQWLAEDAATSPDLAARLRR